MHDWMTDEQIPGGIVLMYISINKFDFDFDFDIVYISFPPHWLDL
jgi:hypothetical protein